MTGFIAWALFLLILMEVIRAYFVSIRQVAANAFKPDNSGLPPFMQRLARAHMNCIEGLPIFGGLMAVAIMTMRTDVTDGLAYWVLAARVAQSSIHLASGSETAATLRFLAFAVQLVIAVYWVFKLS
ncbi:MAPEG family protein [Mesorhizobium sp. L-8-10]|uniref:MAPEG family protein n=1 Tax=Mesorhizobium sp. L-8-10 TaxID=2744523 RepID=UPI0019276713|nr:MAPEG family protein [Mesorhizobium sp. L-8-10]